VQASHFAFLFNKKNMSERIIFYGLNKIKAENNRLFIELLLFLQPFCGLMQNDE
jgi:hypothetical protein